MSAPWLHILAGLKSDQHNDVHCEDDNIAWSCLKFTVRDHEATTVCCQVKYLQICSAMASCMLHLLWQQLWRNTVTTRPVTWLKFNGFVSPSVCESR